MNSDLNNESYRFERRNLNRELFYLLSIFGGSKMLADIAREGKHDMAWELKLAFQSCEIHRLLVSVAVHLRIMFDGHRPIGKDHPDYDILGDFDFRKDIEPVGHLIENVSNPTAIQALHFRTACNKIIHAHKIELQEEVFSQDHWRKQLKPEVILHGSYRDTQWKALINIEQFSRGAYSFTTIDPLEGI